MQFVCTDINGPTQWFFDEEQESYVRKSMVGENLRHIKGEYLPDPESIRALGKEPQAATVDLWNHWQAKKVH